MPVPHDLSREGGEVLRTARVVRPWDATYLNDTTLACRPWFEAEIAALAPEVIVCLGATAAKAILGASFRVTQQRGELLPSPLAKYVMATETRRKETARFVADLERVAKLIGKREAA